MSSEDQTTRGGTGPAGTRGWFGRRKRIVAREVKATPLPVSAEEAAAAVEGEMQSAALGSLRPADVVDVPAAPPALVIDPTQFSERHRKRGENLVYRLTQACALGALLAASVSIVAALLEDPGLARVLAGSACGAGVASVWLVRRSRLAHRLRGYAAAACALAGIALVVSLVVHETPEEQRPAPEKPPVQGQP